MGNLITNDACSECEPVHMSNSLTDVVISVCVLSASALAVTEQEKRFAVWLASRDQDRRGPGVVGFDVSELPWTVHGFTAEHAFLLRVIDSARSHYYWHKLNYKPHTDWVLHALEQLHTLLLHFSQEDLVREGQEGRRADPYWDEPPTGFPTCPRHGVYLHQEGCVVCHDEGIQDE